MQRLGLFFVEDYSCRDMIDYAKLAEANGYDSVWVAEDLGFRDAVGSVASLAMATNRIKLATGILPVYYRSPALTAMTAATLDELSGGRLILGLGTGARRYVERQGIEFSKPLSALREHTDVVRLLLKGESSTYRGRVHVLSEAKLSFRPVRRKIPIYIAARGAKMLQLAGEIANGVLTSDGFCSESYLKWALDNLRKGAERAGRNPRDVDFSSVVLLSVSNDHDEAKENVKPSVLTFLAKGYLDPYLEMWGLTVVDITPTREAWFKGDMKAACKKVPDALLDGSAIYGTPDECEKKMADFRAAGVRMPVIRPIGPKTESIIKLAKNW